MPRVASPMVSGNPTAITTTTPSAHHTAVRYPARNAPIVKDRGAYGMGRNMFGPIRGEWDGDWRGWWGEEPPYHAPVFVLTHHPHEAIVMAGGTTFHFVTDGFKSALAQAVEAAHGDEVDIAGG
jgi:hypothetical protein